MAGAGLLVSGSREERSGGVAGGDEMRRTEALAGMS